MTDSPFLVGVQQMRIYVNEQKSIRLQSNRWGVLFKHE